MDLNPIDMILDENNTDPIVLYNENNDPVQFEQIALIPLDGGTYVILKPVEDIEGIADDEAIVFQITELDGEDVLVVVEDDAIIDVVFDEYYALLKENGIS